MFTSKKRRGKVQMQRLSLLFLFAWCGFAQADSKEAKVPDSKFTNKGHTTDKLDVVKQRLADKQAVLIDVREENEWDAGHLKAATFIPMSRFEADKLTKAMKDQLIKDQPIYLHCRSGGRVLRVAKILKEQGYDVRPLQAGYNKLLEAGFEPATKLEPASK